MRITKLRLAAIIGIGLAGLASMAVLARHHYFRDKLAAVDPVAIDRYALDNASLEATPAGKPRMVLIGDSRIHAMKAAGFGEHFQVVNRGIPGETAAQMRLRFPDDVLALKPDLVIVQSGINDLVAGMASAALAPEISRRVVEHLKASSTKAAAGGARVYLMTIFPPSDPEWVRRLVWSERIREEVRKVNEALLRWNAPPGVTVVDCSQWFGSATRMREDYVLNTLHLNESGYVRIESELARIIGGAAK